MKNQWRHIPTGEVCTFRGPDRDGNDKPYAVMVMEDGTPARIDPLALMRKDGDWKKESST